MFNVPPKRHDQPMLLLRIPSPVSLGVNDKDSGTYLTASGATSKTPGGPRRKPPPIDFSKIHGSHSYTPDTSSPSNPSPGDRSMSDFSTVLQSSDHQGTFPGGSSGVASGASRPVPLPGQFLSQLATTTSTNSKQSTNSTTSTYSTNARSTLRTQAAPMPHVLASQRVNYTSLEHLTPEDWNILANNDDIIELSKLGEGNGGSVSKCKLRSGSPVFALKLINADSNPDVQKQIIRELQYNRLCNSPNIVKYYGTFLVELQSMIGIAMEFMGGRSLDAIYKRVIEIDSTNRMNEKVLGKISESVLRGLSYLHLQRIIHRDIKPSNILLDRYGNVKLCDFGVSGEVVNSLATTFVGTQYYMAPERIMGKPYNVSCDVWSLGLTILEVAMGQFPYHLQTDDTPLGPIELLSLILEYQPQLEDIPEDGIFWSDSFKSFIDFCLKKDFDKRPSPQQMLQHPWCMGQLRLRVDMEKFVKRLWGDNLD